MGFAAGVACGTIRGALAAEGAAVVLVGGGTWIVGAASCAIAGVEPSARTAEIAAVALSDRESMCVMHVTMRKKSMSYTPRNEKMDELNSTARRVDL